MFQGASNFADGVDIAFAVIFGISFILLIGLTAAMLYFLYRYHEKRNKEADQISGSTKLEIIWVIIPLIIVLVMFYFGWQGFAPMRKNVPEDAKVVTAIGRMWEFEFDYGNGKLSRDTLVLPVDKPVRLNLVSEDVNHALFIPAFRVKEDMVPGYDNFLWFIPTVKDTFQIFCAEYCGILHSQMLGKVVVLDEEGFETWLENIVVTDRAAEPIGLQILRRNACIGCHSLDGSQVLGPSFKGYWGSERTVITRQGEMTVIADEEYTRTQIYQPNLMQLKGFPAGLMQSYEGIVSEEELQQIIDFLKTTAE